MTGTEDQQLDERPDEPPRTEQDIAKELRLRPDPPRAMRLSRKAITVLTVAGGLGIGAILIVALQGSDPGDGPSELFSTERVQEAEGLWACRATTRRSHSSGHRSQENSDARFCLRSGEVTPFPSSPRPALRSIRKNNYACRRPRRRDSRRSSPTRDRAAPGLKGHRQPRCGRGHRATRSLPGFCRSGTEAGHDGATGSLPRS